MKLTMRGIFLVAMLAVVGTAMYVRGDEPGITFATNGVDLKIDDKAWYNGSPVASATWAMKKLVPGSDHFFNFYDIKPGDYGCNVISMHVTNTDAWMCLDFTHLTNNDNGVNAPESKVDPNGTTTGELANGTEFFGWVDDGDAIFEPPIEKALFGTSTQSDLSVLSDRSYAVGDSKYGSSCNKNTTKYVGICWCAGNLSVNTSTGKISCDGSTLGNAAQTDSFSVDVSIRAMPAPENPKFLCRPKPPKQDDEGDDKDHNGDNGDDGKGGKSGDDGHDGKNGEDANSSTHITIVNSGSTTSTTKSSSNTSGNSAGPGGTVTTGNASSTATTTNILNRTDIHR